MAEPCLPANRPEPPAKDAPPTQDNQLRLKLWLSAINARVTETAPWQFYWELDQYLGSWGPNGYLLGYGLRYCRLFSMDSILQKHPLARRWVRQTAVLLQDDLAELTFTSFRDGRLPALDNDTLTHRAFAAHATAYVEAGFAHLVRHAPHLVARIVAIPCRELLPWAPHAYRSWTQALLLARMATRDSEISRVCASGTPSSGGDCTE